MDHADNPPEQEEQVATPQSDEVVTNVEIDYEDRWKRSLADIENLKKRQEADRHTLLRFGQQSLIEDILPILDNFSRATKAVPADQAQNPWVVGMQYIQKQLLDVLLNNGVIEMTVLAGDTFDAAKHEAIGTTVNEEVPEDHVIEVVSTGYLLHDRVIRPAHVIVSTR
jgi:molecular chaperone GrpE